MSSLKAGFWVQQKNRRLLLLKSRGRDVLQSYMSQLLSFATEIFQ
jgi:hypothetical protein